MKIKSVLTSLFIILAMYSTVYAQFPPNVQAAYNSAQGAMGQAGSFRYLVLYPMQELMLARKTMALNMRDDAEEVGAPTTGNPDDYPLSIGDEQFADGLQDEGDGQITFDNGNTCMNAGHTCWDAAMTHCSLAEWDEAITDFNTAETFYNAAYNWFVQTYDYFYAAHSHYYFAYLAYKDSYYHYL